MPRCHRQVLSHCPAERRDVRSADPLTAGFVLRATKAR